MKNGKSYAVVVLLLALVMVLAACGGDSGGSESGGDTSADAATVRYVLWDSNQLPAYEACAAAFEEKNPNINIAIEQSGWDDYWNTIQTGFVADEAPDVFTNHLAKYPEFAEKGQILDIQPLVDRDNVPTDIYVGELADLWTRDGKRFGLPKDWDTISVVYNVEMFEAAGIDPSVMETWTWNPQDGGTFQEIAAQLTLDANGNNALSPDFDPNNIEQYGYIRGAAGGAYGQTEWSHFAASNGFKFTDGPWSSSYYYEDPALAETLQWYADTSNVYHIAPGLELVSSLGANTMFTARQGAMVFDGSWQIGFYNSNSDFPIGFAPLPAGPEGRKSMFNGLADSIWAGTDVQDQAWEWVKYLSSPECENMVGEFGVVFPAVQSGVENALASFLEQGLDVSAFTEQALAEGGTFLFPITDNASEITSIMGPTIESIMLGQTTAVDALADADKRVDDSFK